MGPDLEVRERFMKEVAGLLLPIRRKPVPLGLPCQRTIANQAFQRFDNLIARIRDAAVASGEAGFVEKLVRNLLLSCEYLYDNPLHLFVLAGPEPVRALQPFTRKSQRVVNSTRL